MTASLALKGFSSIPRTFGRLCRMLPLRPIHDERAYEAAVAVIDAMAGHELNPDQADYLEVLSELAGVYEDVHFAKILSGIKPAETLRFLAEHNGLNASGLGDLLGSRSLGSKLLRGERELSKSHIRKLCQRFKVSADLFIGDAEGTSRGTG
jgi:HTH-type transcriptional regulator / antitoxin HigA